MNYLDMLPLELLHQIAQDSEPAYYALLSYPRFARVVTLKRRIDYMVGFGHNVCMRKDRIMWLRNNLRHRKDGPAVICTDGSMEWYRSGKHHRDNGPAIQRDSFIAWMQNGIVHREDGPACNVYVRDGPNRTWKIIVSNWYNQGVELTGQLPDGTLRTSIYQ